MTDKISDTQ